MKEDTEVVDVQVRAGVQVLVLVLVELLKLISL